MGRKLRKGDKVEWNTSQGKTTGTVEQRLTRPAKVKGHVAAPSPENPEYRVKSAKTGARAVHRRSALRTKK